MPKQDPRIDNYIMNAADFAMPILLHLRTLVHAGCPDVEETMKWSFPHFMYKGAILCSMASFKQHCAFGFWKASLMKDAKMLEDNRKEAMGSLGRVGNIKDLPSDRKMMALIKEAMKLTEAGAKTDKTRLSLPQKLEIPAFLTTALKKNKKAFAGFNNFSNSHKKEYIEWLVGAKTIPTREKRLADALEWMAEGKSRHWKYKR